MDHNEITIQVEELVRKGDTRQAKSILNQLNARQVPRQNAVSLSKLARRLGLTHLGLNIMRPIVREDTGISKKVYVEEWTIYAALLMTCGALNEALLILEKHHSKKVADSILFLSFCHIRKWDYKSAIKYLDKYLGINGLGAYDVMVAKVNFLAAHVFEEKWSESIRLLNEIVPEIKENNWTLLYANTLELASQVYLQAGKIQLAEKYLNEASALLSKTNTQYAFFIQKWKGILNLMKDPGGKKVGLEIETLRAEAQARESWESVREFDFYKSLIRKDEELFLQVYFGTPNENYRKRMQKKIDFTVNIPSTKIFHLQPGSEDKCFDVLGGREVGKDHSMKLGQSVHKLFCLLVIDRYRPKSVGTLFSEMFSGEYYHPIVSPKRIYFLISELKKWFVAENIPLAIKNISGNYFLSASKAYGVLLDKQMYKYASDADFPLFVRLQYLKQTYEFRRFSSTEAGKCLSLTGRRAGDLLKWAVREKRLKKMGQGKATRYYF